MSDVWSYLSGSRRRGRTDASLSQQSASCCISDTTAAGSPTSGLSHSGSIKFGSVAATSDWRGSSSTITNHATAMLAAAPLPSPATAPSVAASSSLFSPVTAQTELPAALLHRSASMRTSASVRDSATAASLMSFEDGGPATDGEADRIGALYSTPEHDPAALVSPPPQPPADQPGSEAASPLSEWGAYKTPSASRQPTKDHDVGGESPQRVANLNVWPAGSPAAAAAAARRSSSSVSEPATRAAVRRSSSGTSAPVAGHRRTSSSLHPPARTALAEATQAQVGGSGRPTTSGRRTSLASIRSALSSRRTSLRSASLRSTSQAPAPAAPTDDETPSDLERQRTSAIAEPSGSDTVAVPQETAQPDVAAAAAPQASQAGIPNPTGQQTSDHHPTPVVTSGQPWQQKQQPQPAIELLSAPDLPRKSRHGTTSPEQLAHNQPAANAAEEVASSNSSGVAPVFQQPPWRQQPGLNHNKPQAEGSTVYTGTQQQQQYDWLSGDATAHLSKKEQRWQQQLATPYEQWNSSQVADWISNVGMDQYRRSFVHHAVDGKLLGTLTSETLKNELGMHPLGHRQLLLQAIGRLTSAPAASPASSSDGRHGSAGSPPHRKKAASSPAARDAARQQARLMNSLHRAEQLSAQHAEHAERERRRAEAASRQAEQLRGHLATLRRQLHSAPSAAAGGRAALRPGTAPEPSFDQSGRVPWHPPGAVPLPAVGRLSAEDATARPSTSASVPSRGRDGTRPKIGSSEFLRRLQNDLDSREARLQETRQRLIHEEERQWKGGKAQEDADADFLRSYANDAQLGLDMPDSGPLTEAALDELCTHVQGTFEAAAPKAAAAAQLQGAAKASRLAALLRSQLFMRRYEEDLAGRSQRLQQLAHHWSSARPGGDADPAATADADFRGCQEWFAEAGWSTEAFAEPSLVVVDAHVDLLLKRVQAHIANKTPGEDELDKLQKQTAGEQAGAATQPDAFDSSASAQSLGGYNAAAAASTDVRPAAEPGATAAQPAAAGSGGAGAGAAHPGGRLQETVELLAGCHKRDLQKLGGLRGRSRCVFLYRAMRNQQFIAFTKRDIAAREAKTRDAAEAFWAAHPRQQVPQDRIEAFMARLDADAERRIANRKELAKAAQEGSDPARALAHPASKSGPAKG